MPINTKESYVEIGSDINADGTLANVLHLPVPIEMPSANEFFVSAERNANGTMLIEQIGRTQYTSQIKWGNLPNKKWWEINRWFEDYGYVFYLKYFSHTDGRIKIHRFYRGNINKATPSPNQEVIDGISVPKYYSGCGFSVIDMGEEEVKIVKSLVVR